jgi:uncharacterized protein YndB with AHSA1/START domain
MTDAIEREIFVQAGIDRVWSLVSRTGFWVGEKLHFEHAAAEGETVVIDAPPYGTFPVRVDRLDAPRYAAYRWASAFPGAELTDTNSTLVEFSLVERDGGVLVCVRESGFTSIPGDVEFRAAQLKENTSGWTGQLDLLREAAEAVAVG